MLAGILILILSFCLEESILEQVVDNNGFVGLNKTMIKASSRPNVDKNQALTLDDISYLDKKAKGGSITYLTRQDSEAGGNCNWTRARIIGTNYMYPRFRDLHMESGGMWTEEAEREGLRMAVINNDLAWQLFKSTEVVGMDVNILGSTFKVVGVMGKNESLIARLADDGVPEILIPGPVYYSLAKNPEILEIQISGEESGYINELLTGMGKDLSCFSINDYHDTQPLMGQVPQIQVFLIGLLCIVALLRWIRKEFRQLVKLLKKDSCNDYFAVVLKRRWREAAAFLLITGVLIATIIFIWSNIHFQIYVPSRYIPDDLINIQYYTEVIKQDIANGRTAAEFYRPTTDLELGICQNINFFLYFISWPLSLVLLLYGLSRRRWIPKYALKTMVYTAGTMILSLIIVALIGFFTGSKSVLNLHAFIVLWCFIGLKLIYIFVSSSRENGHLTELISFK